MDNLLESFDNSFRVTFDELDTYSKHPRFSSYKEKYTKSCQEERRKDYLLRQKQKKITSINLKRGINDKVDVDKIEKDLIECTKKTPDEKYKRSYKDILMLSEWLMDVPSDFLEDWIVVPCPVGKRVLIVAEKGGTMGFARKGFKVLQRFPSGLPGGSCGHKSYQTRLDCIWNEQAKTIYILDALDLGPNLVNCECQFRFSWLDWKYEELKEDISCERRLNRYSMKFLERFPASQLSQFVSKPLDPSVKMDGLLFFHKEGLYEEYGRSPLVTWLKPYMVPKILGLDVHSDYMADQPQEMETDSSIAEANKM